MRPLHSTLALALFLAFVLVLGQWRTSRPVHDMHIERMGTGAIVLQGRIDGAPETSDRWITYVAGDLTVIDASGATAIGGRVQIRDRRMWPRYTYGETVRLTGTLEIAGHDGYARSLRTRGIQATMFGPRLESIAKPRPSAYGLLIAVREAIEGRLRRLIPEPQASLAVGLLTGTRAAFPAALTDALRISGLTHITAVSGSNVAIVLVLFESALFWIPRRLRTVPLLLSLVLFALFTGASASVIRACIMGGIGVVALHAGRMSQARRGLLLTGGGMLLWNPRLLTGDLGFQLSFLSVIGIVEVSPHLASLLKRVPNTLALRESLALTMASQCMAAPWIAYQLGTVSLVSLLSNILATPLIPWAMLFSALAVALFPIGLIVAFLAHIPLSLIIAIAKGTAMLPYASWDGVHIPLPAIIAYYVLLAAILWTLSYINTPAPVTERVDVLSRN